MQFDMGERSRGQHVRTQAEVDKRTLAITGNLVTAFFPNEFGLEILSHVQEQTDGFFLGENDALDGLILGRDGLHPVFDGLQVLDGKRSFPVKIVIVPGLDGRSDPDFRSGKKLGHGMSEKMGRAVAENFEGVGVLTGQKGDVGIRIDPGSEIKNIAVDPGGNRRTGKSESGGDFGQTETLTRLKRRGIRFFFD
jgi:hypothetical protein